MEVHLLGGVTDTQSKLIVTDLQSGEQNGELGYELYDHKNDKEELINLARNQNYNKVVDSLKLVIEQRITDASIKPQGIGRQFENAKLMPKAKKHNFWRYS